MLKRSILALFALALVAGCQTAAPPKKVEPVAPPAPAPVAVAQPTLPAWVGALQERAAALPAAQTTSAEGTLSIAYPQERLFSTGSALPLAGGAEALDPLANLLIAFPDASWDAMVQAATTQGADYDRALAQKRGELLDRYLRNRGLPAGRVHWQSTAGSGAPLELHLRPVQLTGGNSAGAKP